MKTKKICGIYKITNKTNGKCYIGQSKDIFTRWKQHIYNTHYKDINYMITNAINKYGKENFLWEILEECDSEELNQKEIFYIKEFNSYIGWGDSNGYNMTTGGDGHQGSTLQVDQYDKNGNFIKRYWSITEAADKNNVYKTQIVQCCKLNPKYRSAGGYQWRYAGDSPPNEYQYRDVVKVAQYALDGELIRLYCSGQEAADIHNISYGYLMSCCRKNTPTFLNCIWKSIELNGKNGD